MSNATWLKCSLMAVCSDKKYNSYRSANLFFFFLWNKLWKKTLNFGSFTWEIKEPSLYWNNSWLQHPLWSKRSAVFELLIVQFRLAFSEDFQVFHLEEMPLAPFSLFFFFAREHLLHQPTQISCILVWKFFLFHLYPQKTTSPHAEENIINKYLFSGCGEQWVWTQV